MNRAFPSFHESDIAHNENEPTIDAKVSYIYQDTTVGCQVTTYLSVAGKARDKGRIKVHETWEQQFSPAL